jgi:hypothetical protein
MRKQGRRIPGSEPAALEDAADRGKQRGKCGDTVEAAVLADNPDDREGK